MWSPEEQWGAQGALCLRQWLWARSPLGPPISRGCHLILSPKKGGYGRASLLASASRGASCWPVCLLPTHWQSPSAQGRGCAHPAQSLPPPPAPPTSVELKPYTLGAVHPPPQTHTPRSKTRNFPSCCGAGAPWASRATSRPGVLSGPLLSPTCRAWPNLGSCHTRTPHSSVWCCAQSTVSRTQRFLAAGCRLLPPRPRTQAPGLRPPCPGATATIQPGALPALPALGLYPGAPTPPQTLQLTPCCLPRGEGQTARPDTLLSHLLSE